MEPTAGYLMLVPTPIGNLSDFTPRAIEVLRSVDLILAEDTRTTGKLLRHAEIDRPLKAFHLHNEHRITDHLVSEMIRGARFALCSDAGTPGISDPGFLLVRACVEAGVGVICLPGPTAFVPALAASGLPCDRFVFEGFLPHKKGRQKRLSSLAQEERTLVFYESPHRLMKLLSELIDCMGESRPVVVGREISKLHEEYIRGSATEVMAHFQEQEPRGEIVVIVGGCPD